MHIPLFSLPSLKSLLALAFVFFVVFPRGTDLLGANQAPGTQSLKLSQQDWAWWRGPQRNGYSNSRNPPLKWDEDQNILWKTSIPGRGHGSPIVVGNQVFLATADEIEQTQSVLCLDRQTGKVKWSKQLHKGGWVGRIHEKNTQASSSLASDGERLFATFMLDERIFLTALSLDGKVLWQEAASDYVSHWGYSSSPAIYDKFVIVASDHKEGGNLTAFDRKTGKKAWNAERPAIPNYASPVIYYLDGRDQLILPGCDLMASYDPKTGKELWSVPATTRETIGSAVADQNRVYASGGYPKNETVCILADGSKTIAWKNAIRVYTPSMLAVDGYLYAMTDTGIAHCWDAANGKLMWREKVGGDFSSSPTLAGDKLYVSSEEGDTVVFKADPSKFELLANNKLGDETMASPVIVGNRIFLRVAHHDENGLRTEKLYCVGKQPSSIPIATPL